MPEQCEHYTDDAQAGDAVAFRWVYSLTDAASAGDTLDYICRIELSDNAQAGDALAVRGVSQISDDAQGGDALTWVAQWTYSITDAALAGDALAYLSGISLTDDAQAGEALTLAVRLAISDAATAGDALAYTQTLVYSVTDDAQAREAFEPRSRVVLTDEAVGGDALAYAMRLTQAYSDGAVGGDTLTYTMRFVAQLTDAATAGDALGWSMALVYSLTDAAIADDRVTTSKDAAPGAFTASTDRLAISHYSNMPCNSACYAFGRVLLATDDGLVALEGTTDQGDALTGQAWSTGLLDITELATSIRGRPLEQHRIEALYVSTLGEGAGVVTVSNPQLGEEEVSWEYEVPGRAAAVPVTNRVKLGRGMRSRYYRISYTVADGLPMQFHDLNISAAAVSRKF